jgi:hypothetical protein
VADRASPDDWLEALGVVTQFINCLIRQEQFGGLEDAEFDLVIVSYDGLHADRREEIRRHLDLIMTGALQDRMEVKYAAEIRQRRMEGSRTDRAWKFFEPAPAACGFWPPARSTFMSSGATSTGRSRPRPRLSTARRWLPTTRGGMCCGTRPVTPRWPAGWTTTSSTPRTWQ